jgi:hypothetical protein
VDGSLMPKTLEWQATDGTRLTIPAMPGLAGANMPRVAWASRPNALTGGNRLTQVRHAARDLLVPMWLEDDTETGLDDLVRLWARLTDASRGEGILRSVAADGELRELTCICTGGLEGLEDDESWGVPPHTSLAYLKAVLSFHAPDPYWYDPITRGTVFRTGEAPAWFPWPPIQVGPSSINASQVVLNGGDVEAWPVWDIAGPFTRVELANRRTGRTLILDATKLTGQWVRIDTRDKTVVDESGASRYADVARDPTSTMWSLASGPNELTITVAGSVDDETELALAYQARYLTP